MSRLTHRGGSRARAGGSAGKGQTHPGCIIAFCSLFVAAGLAIFFFLTVRPTYQVYSAQSWIEVPCVITSSTVEQHSGEDGYTYTIEIGYTYFFDGAELAGDRYDFDLSSNNERDRCDEIVRRYPVGLDTICYVDPDHPEDAVLDRQYGSYLWVGLFGFIFMAVPIFIMVIALRSQRARSGPRSIRSPGRSRKSAVAVEVPTPESTGFLELKRESSRGQKAFILCFAALFWNGIVSVFLFQAVGMGGGVFSWGMMLFMVPFVLVGIGIIGAAGHSLLALFNPRATLTLRRAELSPGDEVEFAWEFTGRVEKLERLTISFVGMERATYRVGTDTRTDEHRFHEETCVEREVGEDLSFGTTRLQIPPGSLPSFKSRNNEVVWFLELVGEIARWPDVKTKFPVPIIPHPVDAASAGRSGRGES